MSTAYFLDFYIPLFVEKVQANGRRVGRLDEFVYQAVVDPKFLSREVRNVLNKEPIVLPLWDPMGALA